MLSSFTLHQPATVTEASEMLRHYGDDAAIYAGGTELLVIMKERLVHFGHLISIKRLPGLSGIAIDDSSMSIGALTSHRAIETSPLVHKHAPLLAEVEAQVANIRVRNAGTIGGNLCFAEPHSDPATLFAAWDARFILNSAAGSRTVNSTDFFTGLLETIRQPDEVMTGIELPLLPATAGSSYQRFKTHERPTAAAAVTLWLDHGQIRDARVVAGSVGIGPERLIDVESMMIGQPPSPALFSSVAEAAARLTYIEEEGFESSEYKRHLIQVLTRRALHEAAERAA